MSTPRRVEVKSFAKVNLDLRVLHRRPDGFHEIRSFFHTISLFDRIELTFSPGRKTRISTHCPGIDLPEEENLAHRAALTWFERTKVRGELTISIGKSIPTGGGLGGGSSNAAAVLLALPALTSRALPMASLLELAAPLGSDVPFFLMGGAAIAMGRGEELYPAPALPPLHGLLIAPGISVSTPEAYRSLALSEETAASARIVREFSSQVASLPDRLASFSTSSADPSVWPLGFGVNDFEGPVFAANPSLRTWKQRLRRTGALHAMMSGSGSSVFGLYASKSAAVLAAAKLPEGASRLFRLLPRRKYQHAWHRSLHPYSNQLWPPHPQID